MELPRLVLGRRPLRYDAHGAALAGLAAGAIAGAVLGALLLVGDLAGGRGPWAGLRTVASTFRGPSALGRGFDFPSVALGALAHAGLSLAFGLAFGLAAYRWRRATVMWAGALWGLLVYAFMLTLALPAANPALVRGQVGFVAALLHLAFGLVLAAAFAWLRLRSSVPSGSARMGRTVTIEPTRRS